MIAHIQDMLRIGVDYQQSNWTRLLPRIMFTVNSNDASATGMSPFLVERGREPLVMLDRDKAIVSQQPKREDTKEFLERIWDIEEKVAENLAKAKDHAAKYHDRHRNRDAEAYEPGDRVWLSTKGITMPWDKERKR